MATKGKSNKKNKNNVDKIEKELDVIEKNLEVVEKMNKRKKQQIKQEEERQKEIEGKVQAIREDLKDQLMTQNKFGKQFDDMVEDYIYLVRLKESLQYDISENGIRYEVMTGNGFKTEKPNESCERLLKVNAQMLKILQDLNLKAPEEEGGEEGDDLL